MTTATFDRSGRPHKKKRPGVTKLLLDTVSTWPVPSLSEGTCIKQHNTRMHVGFMEEELQHFYLSISFIIFLAAVIPCICA